MNNKSIIVLIISIVWGVLCWYWYVTHIKGFELRKTEITATKNFNSSITFNKSSAEFIIGNTFEQFADSLKMAISNGYRVTLIGLFDKNEKNTSGFDNLGIARANSIKTVLSTYLDTSKIETIANQFTFNENYKSQICHQIILDTLSSDTTNLTVIESDKSDLNYTEKTVEKNDVRYTIYFEPNSNQILNKIEVIKYLENLAEELITKNSSLTITGYRDTDEKEKLDRSRAWLIKSILMQNGTLSNKLKTDGKADLEAIKNSASNSNKKMNRRVELK